MLAEERFSLIMEQLNRKRTVTVQQLCEALHTSESTIRRDLTELDRQGRLTKVHGGAPLLDSRFLADEPTMEAKETLAVEQKRSIAQAAAQAHHRRSILCSSMQAPPRWSWCVHWRGMPSKASYVTNGVAHARVLAQRAAGCICPEDCCGPRPKPLWVLRRSAASSSTILPRRSWVPTVWRWMPVLPRRTPRKLP